MQAESVAFRSVKRAPGQMISLIAIVMHVLVTPWLVPVLSADTFSGKAFYEWSYNTDEGPEQGYNEFAFSRVYLALARDISERVKIKLTTDIARPGDSWTVFQKIASLHWTGLGGEVIIGLQGMNIWNVLEATWGYRFLEKTPMDLHHFGSSADLGLGYRRDVGQNVHLHFTLMNGPGYKQTENDRFKRLTAQIVYGATRLNQEPGFNAGVVASGEPYSDSTAAEVQTSIRTLLALFGGLSFRKFRLGFEFDHYADTGNTPTRQILACYTDIRLQPRLSVFSRMDAFYPGVSGDSEIYLILGLNYTALKQFHIAPNLRFRPSEENDSGIAGLSSINVNVEFLY